MPDKKPPPLIEAIFELRWGNIQRTETGDVEIQFQDEEKTLLPGLFKSLAKDHFPFYKKINDGLPMDLPHVVRHQYWTKENTWPCIQLGLGIITANFGNKLGSTDGGYAWESFKETCLLSLRLLEQCYSNLSILDNLRELPAVGVELRYQDGFLLIENESDSDFVSKRAQITFDLPEQFLKSDLIGGVAENHHISFSLQSEKPKGILVNKLDRGFNAGDKAYIQNTIVRSADALCPEIDIENIMENWLEEAHTLQKHVYDHLIEPTNQRS